jgi:outer membrane biosynthesis protein TonB
VRPVSRRGLARRGRAQEGRALAVMGTVVLHGVVAGLLFARPSGGHLQAPVYAVQLVAAPAATPNARPAPDVVSRPAEQPAPKITTRPPPPKRTSVAKAPPPPAPDAKRREAAPRTSPDSLAPGVQPSTGNDVATVNLPGVTFPYPAYLKNIVSAVFRRWHRPTGDTPLESEVQFFIHRDGSVSDIQFIKRSGNFAFDLEAQGAIEAAGNTKAFGPLPEGYPADILPVSFFFNPASVH